MRDRPNGADLLEVARVSLLEEVAPVLKGQPRYIALMVANAMGVSHDRELNQEERSRRAWKAVLDRVPGDGDAPVDAVDRTARRLNSIGPAPTPTPRSTRLSPKRSRSPRAYGSRPGPARPADRSRRRLLPFFKPVDDPATQLAAVAADGDADMAARHDVLGIILVAGLSRPERRSPAAE